MQKILCLCDKGCYIIREMDTFYSHISAVAENNTIGFKGQLPWRIPEDLKFFYQKTKGRALIMGRKTFESLGQALPHRLHVVVTRQKNFQPRFGLNYIPIWTGGISHIQGGTADPLEALKKALSVVLSPSLKEAMAFCAQKEIKQKYGSEVFITGGGEIYKQSLLLVHRIYLTRIHKTYKGDAFYPEIPKELFKETERTDRKGDPPYSFITYEKI